MNLLQQREELLKKQQEDARKEIEIKRGIAKELFYEFRTLIERSLNTMLRQKSKDFGAEMVKSGKTEIYHYPCSFIISDHNYRLWKNMSRQIRQVTGSYDTSENPRLVNESVDTFIKSFNKKRGKEYLLLALFKKHISRILEKEFGQETIEKLYISQFSLKMHLDLDNSGRDIHQIRFQIHLGLTFDDPISEFSSRYDWAYKRRFYSLSKEIPDEREYAFVDFIMGNRRYLFEGTEWQIGL